ncbi:hypothetical protein [Xenorhabdus sp. KK7.4]|uniref:hypothetical protein n=1 Tax=Xenorhabdus sp. KK7.4 TaxID=1851572 RepID=UPI000C05ECB1|nr:hypothetical protein [Xenorhabdus sp. KK7.4]PHM58484.1 hypothetical protein Xekk_01365 [Xenorhabdus sp. KK7.4]
MTIQINWPDDSSTTSGYMNDLLVNQLNKGNVLSQRTETEKVQKNIGTSALSRVIA